MPEKKSEYEKENERTDKIARRLVRRAKGMVINASTLRRRNPEVYKEVNQVYDLVSRLPKPKRISDTSEAGRAQVSIANAYLKASDLLNRLESEGIYSSVKRAAGKMAIDAFNLADVYSHSRAREYAGASKGLGKFLAIISIFSFIAALFFLSFGFTGAAIGSLPFSGTRWIGLGFVVAGIALALVYFRNNNVDGKNKK